LALCGNHAGLDDVGGEVETGCEWGANILSTLGGTTAKRVNVFVRFAQMNKAFNRVGDETQWKTQRLCFPGRDGGINMNKRPAYAHGASTFEGSHTQPYSHRELDESLEQLPEPNFDWRPFPPRLSEEEARSLATPQVVLFANWSEESEEALRAFEREHIGLSLLGDPDASHPRAVWGNNVFAGLEQIEMLLTSLQAMKARILADMERANDAHPHPRDPLLTQWMATITDRQLAAARNIMSGLQAQRRSRARFEGGTG